VDEDEENETSNDTVGDVVWMSVVSVDVKRKIRTSEGDESKGNESRDGISSVIEVDLRDIAHHQSSDNNQD
jgi:hypothetical protein